MVRRKRLLACDLTTSTTTQHHQLTPNFLASFFTNIVLGGRGGLSNNHPGNHMFRRVVNENKELYHKCEKKSHRFFLAVSIIAAVERNGGRFLKRDEKAGKWVKIPRKDAIAKTNQALREQDVKTRKSPEAIERQVEKKQLQRQRKLQEKQHLQKQVMQTIPLSAAAAMATGSSKKKRDSKSRRPTEANVERPHNHPLMQLQQEVHCGIGVVSSPLSHRQQQPHRRSVPGQWVSEDNPLLNVILKADVGVPVDPVTSNGDDVVGNADTNSTEITKFASLEDIMLEEDLSLDSSDYSSDDECNGLSTSLFNFPTTNSFPSFGGGDFGESLMMGGAPSNYFPSREQFIAESHNGLGIVDNSDVLEGLAFLSS